MATTPRGTTPLDALTRRQEQVIRLIADGRSNPQIATELDLTFDGV
jgi:DNA-binding NarL/FixJ family response regulator